MRGRGLLIGMDIVTDRKLRTPAAELSIALGKAAIDLGLSVQAMAIPGMEEELQRG
ncbi:hypothetical protein SEUCBS140593_007922 [Sporothrix eucalyptigena]|uniref:Uncharacterized protein n=1 Tax=Sporothrix eucalyptigena TaxID=1812306 RepID=A0ABP0CHY1_9PEZI